FRGGLMEIRPDRLASGGVEGDHVVGALNGVHDAVDDQRGDLVLIERARLEYPLERQILGVIGRDLLELAVALAHAAAVVAQPVLRLLIGVEDAVERDRGDVGFAINGASASALSPSEGASNEGDGQEYRWCLHMYLSTGQRVGRVCIQVTQNR